MSDSDNCLINFIVRGRVQGVGFRRFVYKHACALSLNGWVRNLSDGGVEVEAWGSEKIVNGFVEVVKKGSFISRVDELEIVKRGVASEECRAGFEIRH